jgi:hypothetical protein
MEMSKRSAFILQEGHGALKVIGKDEKTRTLEQNRRR